MKYTERLNTAIAIAARAHTGQFRKATDIPYIPYISHPYAVAAIVSEYTSDEDVVIGALFHDILEDVLPDVYSKKQMAREFGERVVQLVVAVSEDKRPDEPEKPWRERKQTYLEHLCTSDDMGVILISAADKLHNLSSIISDHEQMGDTLWGRFNAGASDQLWYYQAVSHIISQKLGHAHKLAVRLAEHVATLQKIIAKSNSVN